MTTAKATSISLKYDPGGMMNAISILILKTGKFTPTENKKGPVVSFHHGVWENVWKIY